MLNDLKVLAFDIDGVLTDGRVTPGDSGEQVKQLRLRDLDALMRAKQEGLIIALVTGEQEARSRR